MGNIMNQLTQACDFSDKTLFGAWVMRGSMIFCMYIILKNFKRIFTKILFGLMLGLSLAAIAHDGTPHQHEEHQGEHSDHEQDHVEITAELAQKTGIRTIVAGAGQLHQTILLFGRIAPDPQRISHIGARFPGLIRRVNIQIGDDVSAGDVIATVEANDSLRVYSITSPISGILIDRHANVGEFTGEQTLFTIANYDQLELDLTVFPQDAEKIRVGQTVSIHRSDAREKVAIATGVIKYLTAGTGNAPVFTAHIPLENPHQKLVPGSLVEAMVNVATIEISLLIDKRALQKVRSRSVVFVKTGDQYEMRPLILGRSDASFVEVLSGLAPGEHYVVENSYLLKADLEKSGAAHVH